METEKHEPWIELIRVMAVRQVTSKTLSEKLGMHVMTISNYRNGKRSPNLDTIRQIAAALEINPKELV